MTAWCTDLTPFMSCSRKGRAGERLTTLAKAGSMDQSVSAEAEERQCPSFVQMEQGRPFVFALVADCSRKHRIDALVAESEALQQAALQRADLAEVPLDRGSQKT